MERFKIYDILHHDRICQIRLSLKDHRCIKGIFDQMEGLLIKIKFSAFQQERGGLLQLTFCVDKSDLKRAQKALRESDLKEEDIHILHEAGMVAIYGPHFVERPGIIAVMHNALSSQGVKVLAISTTLSTSFFVIPACIAAIACVFSFCMSMRNLLTCLFVCYHPNPPQFYGLNDSIPLLKFREF